MQAHTFTHKTIDKCLGFPRGDVVKTIGGHGGNGAATGAKWYPQSLVSHTDRDTLSPLAEV